MAQPGTFERDGVIYRDNGDGTATVVGYSGGPAQSLAPPDPRIMPQVQREQAQAEVATQTLPSVIQKTRAEGVKAEADAAAAAAGAAETRMNLERDQRAAALKALRSGFNTNNILQVIRRARKTAQEEGGTGWAALLSGVPNTTARKLKGDLDTIFGNLSFERLQQMREESPTGAGVGAASDRDIALLGTTVANLDAAVELPVFLERLDQIERSFIGMQVAAAGYDPASPEGQEIFKREFGYTGVFDGETPEGRDRLAAAGATTGAGEIPQQYQADHLRYLRDNWGRMDPRAYARFRTNLDNQYGLNPNPTAYAEAVPGFNKLASEGGTPEQLGAVPAAPRPLGAIEAGLNTAAQSAPGAFFANMGNAVGMGLPARLGGEQAALELLRDVRPYSSFLGETAGQALGALATGGAAGAAGAGMLARPFGAELLQGTVYGATQDDNALRGATTGALGSLAGSYLGQKVGQAFPGTFAPDALAAAQDAVPTVPQLKEQAAELYANVQANGNTASPFQTQDMIDRARQTLAGQGRIGPNGESLLQDGATKQAYALIESFAGLPMTPVQAQTVRETLGEGLTSNVPKERRIASMLLEQFDDWAGPVMPGAEQAREVSSRYIRGQQLQDLAGLGVRRGNRLKGNDVADSTRTLFGQLDEKVAKGQAFFDGPTQEAISNVAQGDNLTNALRALGKYGFGSFLPTTGMMAGGASTALMQTDPMLMAIPAAVGAIGTGARKLAERRTMDAAKNAEMTALGGPEYEAALAEVLERAGLYAGRIGGGIFSVPASATTREPRPLPR